MKIWWKKIYVFYTSQCSPVSKSQFDTWGKISPHLVWTTWSQKWRFRVIWCLLLWFSVDVSDTMSVSILSLAASAYADTVSVTEISRQSTTHSISSLRLCNATYKHSHSPCSKQQTKLLSHYFVKFPPTLIIFGRKMAKVMELCDIIHFPCHQICVSALPC